MAKRVLQAVVVLVVGLAVSGVGQAAAGGAKLAFDVASIRKNVAGTGSCGPDQMQATPNGFRMTNCPMVLALIAAYAPANGGDLGFVVNDRIVGMPDWMKQERYDIDARVSEADAERWKDLTLRKAMLHEMMQSLLEERCKMAAHREMKDKPVYALVIGKNGSKLKVAESTEVAGIRAKHPNGVQIPGGDGMVAPGKTPGNVELYGASLETVALLLSNPAGRPIVNRTGLTGRYDLTFDMPRGGDDGVSVFSMVQEEFGLKLESQKDLVEILVIDHVERPSAN